MDPPLTLIEFFSSTHYAGFKVDPPVSPSGGVGRSLMMNANDYDEDDAFRAHFRSFFVSKIVHILILL